MAVGNLVANLSLNTGGFSKGLSSAQSNLSTFSKSVSSLTTIGLAANGIQSLVGMAQRLAGTLSQPIKLFADFEQAQTAFTVMLGSGEAANKMLADMRQLASTTPLESKDIQQAGKTLLQFGVSAENLIPIMRMLGDATGGDAERFSRMSLAFAQMSAAGRLMGQDLLQMINAGFNPLQTMSKTTGKSMTQLKKQMEAGGISTAMVMKAFQDATSAGGQFSGMMQKQSQTLSGKWSTLKDNVGIALTDIGMAITEGFNLKGMIGDAAAFAQSFSSQFMGPITQAINFAGGVFQSWVSAQKAAFGALLAAWNGGIMSVPTVMQSAFGQMSGTLAAFMAPALTGWTLLVGAASSAISTMQTAWDNWLGAALAVWGEWTNSIISTVAQWAGIVGTTAGSWITPFLEQVADLFANFDLYLLIGVEQVKMFAANISSQILAGLTTAISYVTWFGSTVGSVLGTIGGNFVTLFTNIGDNIKAIWTAVLEFISTGEFRVSAQSLNWGVEDVTDTMMDAIAEMPGITEAQIQQMTPELERLYGELGQRQADAQAKGLANAAKLTPPALKVPGLQGQDTLKIDSAKVNGSSKQKLSGAAEFGSREAASVIANSVNRNRDELNEAKKHTKLLQDLVKKNPTATTLAMPLAVLP